ncbi:hypothetical protein JCM11251_001329 [Rhodosporidiobolus azoricus]
MATSPAPSTPTGATSTPSSTPATSVDKHASADSPSQQESVEQNKMQTEVLMLDDSSSDVEMRQVEADKDKGAQGKGEAAGEKKRKGEDSPSAPASKKSKASSAASTSTGKKPAAPKARKDDASTKAKATLKKDEGEMKKELGIVTLNLKTAKLDIKQKVLDVKMAKGYTEELAAFVQYATNLFSGSADDGSGSEDEDDKKKKKKKAASKKGKGKKKATVLDDWPEEHHALVAKLLHESSANLGSAAGLIKKELVNAIENAKMLLDTDEDSQEKEDEGEMSIKDRLPIAPLKSLISTLATRNNYGLTPSLCSTINGIDVDDVPEKLAYWCWEVKEEKMEELKEGLGEKGEGLRGKWEKRRSEREQAQKDALSLFAALTFEQRSALLAGSASKPTTASTSADKKGKGKATSPTSDAAPAEDDGEGDDESSTSADQKAKKPVKEKAPKGKQEKVLTDEQKKEMEEKARVKAEQEAEKAAEKEAKKKEKEERDAEKELKRRERDAEKEVKRKEREKDKMEKEAQKAVKERARREKEEEDERKEKLKKKQSNAFASFFMKTSPVPEAGPSNSASTPQKGASPSLSNSASSSKPSTSTAISKSTADSDSASKPKKEKGFDAVFFPFKVRERVEVAEVCWDAVRRGKRVERVEVKEEGEMSRNDLLTSLRSRRPRIRLTNLSHYPSPPVTVRSAVEEIDAATSTNNDVSQHYAQLNDRNKVVVKLLKFREDVRPGYIGTWTKTSKVVGFRTPFAKETALLNYDYDSEGEWEDEPEGEGEDVLSDGEEEKDDPGAASEADSWLAEDDEIEYEEGYDEGDDIVMLDAEGKAKVGDSDVEIVEDEAEKKKRKKAAEKKKKEAEERQKKRKAALGNRPVIKGLAWEDEQGKSTEPLFSTMKVHFLNDASFGLNPFTFVSKPFASPSATSSSAGLGKGKENVVLSTTAANFTASDGKSPSLAPAADGTVNILKPKKAAPAKPFPAEHLARFVKFVNGSDRTKVLLVDDFLRTLKGEGVAITKAAVEAKFAEITVKKRVKGVLSVKEEVLVRLSSSSMLLASS